MKESRIEKVYSKENQEDTMNRDLWSRGIFARDGFLDLVSICFVLANERNRDAQFLVRNIGMIGDCFV